MSKRKIAILINTLAGGGAERTVTHLLRNLRDDYEVHLVLFSDVIEYELPKDQIVTFLDNENPSQSNVVNILKIPKLSRRLVKYCRNNNIDLIMSFLNRPNFVACLAKKLGLKAKLLISERTYTPHYYRNDNASGVIGKWLISTLYPLADAILPNSRGTMSALQKQFRVNNNYTLVRNLLDLGDIENKMAEVVDDARFDKFTFVHVGSFSFMKGHRMLVEAFAKLKFNKDAQLLLIGRGPLHKEINALVAVLKLQDQVIFLGHKSNPFKYMARSDCFVFASEFEGFPNVLLEALACGLPVISTDCLTGPRELLMPSEVASSKQDSVIEFGRNGVLVPVGNIQAMSEAMCEMMTNDEMRIAYKEIAANKAREFDQTIISEEFRQIINDHLSC